MAWLMLTGAIVAEVVATLALRGTAGEFRPLPALTAQRVTVFASPQTTRSLAGVAVPPGVDDIVGSRVVGLDECLLMVTRGEITDGLTIASLLLLLTWLDSGGEGPW